MVSMALETLAESADVDIPQTRLVSSSLRSSLLLTLSSAPRVLSLSSREAREVDDLPLPDDLLRSDVTLPFQDLEDLADWLACRWRGI